MFERLDDLADLAVLTLLIAAIWLLVALWIPRKGGLYWNLTWIFKILLPLSAIAAFGLMYFGVI